MLTLRATANHVVLHCSIYACVMSQMFLFYFIFYGGALVFLGGAGAPASPSLAPPMQTCVICITSAVSVLGAYKPCPREAHRFRLALFCSLLKVYYFWTCRVSILHQMDTALPCVRSNTPDTCEVIGWTFLDRIKMQTDRQTHRDSCFY